MKLQTPIGERYSYNFTQLTPFSFITQAVALNMTLNGTLLEEIEKVPHNHFA